MSKQDIDLNEFIKPYERHIQLLYKKIQELEEQKNAYRSKYELLKRGIPVYEIENMFRDYK